MHGGRIFGRRWYEWGGSDGVCAAFDGVYADAVGRGREHAVFGVCGDATGLGEVLAAGDAEA